MNSPAIGSDGPHDDTRAADLTDAASAGSPPTKRSRRLRPGLWAVGACLLLTVMLRGGLWPASGSASTAEQSLIPSMGTGSAGSADSNLSSGTVSNATSPSAESSHPGTAPAANAQQSGTVGSDEQHRRRIIGLWEQENHGLRTLDVHADGTALMVVQPESAWQILFGERLEFDVRWVVQNGRLETTVVAARPGATARAARQMYGDHHVSPIIVLNDTLMRLNDEEGEEHTPWHRSAVAPKSPEPGN